GVSPHPGRSWGPAPPGTRRARAAPARSTSVVTERRGTPPDQSAVAVGRARPRETGRRRRATTTGGWHSATDRRAAPAGRPTPTPARSTTVGPGRGRP